MRTALAVTAIICLLLLAPRWASSQAPTAPTPPSASDQPATKFERVLLSKGTMRVKEYYVLGAIAGRFGSRAQFEVARTFVPGTQDAVMALRVDVKEAGRLERSHIGALDRDEVSSLATAIPQMAKIAGSMKQKQELSENGSSEITFSGGSLTFTVFMPRDRGDGGVAIRAGNIGSTTAFFELADLSRIEKFVSDAVAKMQALSTERK